MFLNTSYNNTYISNGNQNSISPNNSQSVNNIDNSCELQYSDVEKAISLLANNKTSGSDKVIAEQIKHGGLMLYSALFDILKTVWSKQQMPAAWKQINVTPLYKGKGEKSLLDNYRPVAVIPVIARIYTKIITEKISEITEGKLMECQNGFRKERGCRDSIFVIKQAIEKAKEFKSSLIIGFIDLRKAYDSVIHQQLWKILKEFYTVPEQLIQLIKDIYTDSTTSYKSGSVLSAPSVSKRGLRQGCPLSPILFNLYINYTLSQILPQLPGQVEMDTLERRERLHWTRDNRGKTTRNVMPLGQYADDIAVISKTARDLEESLRILDENLSKAGLDISIQKTEIMHVNPTTTVDRSPPIVKLRETALKTTTKFKYLGTLINDCNSLEDEIIERKRKALIAFGINKAVLMDRNIQQKIRIQLFAVYVNTIITHGCETWTITKGQKKELQSLQNSLMRRMLGKNRFFSNSKLYSLMQQYNVTPVEVWIDDARLGYFGHVQRMHPQREPNQMLYSDMANAQRIKGRPPKRFRDDIYNIIKQDAQQRGDNKIIEKVFQKAANRVEWRKYRWERKKNQIENSIKSAKTTEEGNNSQKHKYTRAQMMLIYKRKVENGLEGSLNLHIVDDEQQQQIEANRQKEEQERAEQEQLRKQHEDQENRRIIQQREHEKQREKEQEKESRRVQQQKEQQERETQRREQQQAQERELNSVERETEFRKEQRKEQIKPTFIPIEKLQSIKNREEQEQKQQNQRNVLVETAKQPQQPQQSTHRRESISDLCFYDCSEDEDERSYEKPVKPRRRNAIFSTEWDLDEDKTSSTTEESQQKELKTNAQNPELKNAVELKTIADAKEVEIGFNVKSSQNSQNSSFSNKANNELFQCKTPGCEKSFASKQSLKGHTNVCGKAEHQNLLECPNEYCMNRIKDPGKKYKGINGLKRHLNSCNANQKK